MVTPPPYAAQRCAAQQYTVRGVAAKGSEQSTRRCERMRGKRVRAQQREWRRARRLQCKCRFDVCRQRAAALLPPDMLLITAPDDCVAGFLMLDKIFRLSPLDCRRRCFHAADDFSYAMLMLYFRLFS